MREDSELPSNGTQQQTATRLFEESQTRSCSSAVLLSMAEIQMCEPFELFNLLNSCIRGVSRLSEINFLCLIDARETEDYRTSHIPTAKHAKTGAVGWFLLPEAVEVDSMQHVVVYDGCAGCLQEQGRAVDCARVLAEASLCPVYVVRGGFQRFSALYPFLRTEKILYTIRELEDLKPYPLEVLAGLLYMGDKEPGSDSSILKDLKISVVISVSQSNTGGSTKGDRTIVNIPLVRSGSDLNSCFERICSLIDSHVNVGSRVLLVSEDGRSCSETVTVAFLMHNLKYTLEEAWKYALKCKPDMKPNAGFLQQLSDWESHIVGTRVTDISEPPF